MAGLSARMHVDRAWLAEGIEGASGACPVPTRLTGFLPNPASCALPCSRPQHPASELSWTQSSFEESGRREGEKEQIVSRKRGSERVGSGDACGERAERWWLGGGGRAAGHASCVGDEQGGAHSRLALTQLSPGRHRHLQTEGLSISKIPGWTRNPSRPH